MAILRQNFESGTHGVALAPANSGGGGNTAVNFVTLGAGATANYDNTQKAHGALSVKVDPSATPTNVTIDLRTGLTATTQIAFRGYFYFTAATTADLHLIRFSADGGTTRTASLHLNGTSRLRLSDSGATTGIWTATDPVPLNQWVRVEVYLKVGADTATGTLSVGVYLGDSTTPIEAVFTSTTANLGTVAINTVQVGKITAANNPAVFWLDDTAINDAATGFVGPWVSTAPVANAGAAQTLEPYSTVTLAGTDSDSDGTVTAREWRQVSGTAVVLSGATTATATYEAPGTVPGASLVFAYKVTDNDGQTHEATVTHTVLPVTERAVVAGVEVPIRFSLVSNA